MTYGNNLINLTIIAVIITNLSQIPLIIRLGFTRYFSIPVWIVVFLFLIINNKIIIKKVESKILILGLIFLIGALIAELFTAKKQISSNLIPAFYLSLFIFLIGLSIQKNISEVDYYKLFNSYIISIGIVSIAVYIEAFSSNFNWLSADYAYASKNSISQMIFTAIVFIIVMYNPKKNIIKILKICFLFFWLYLLLALKSRATIISLATIPIIIFIYSKNTFKNKITIIFVIVGIVILLFLNSSLREIIVNGVLFGGRNERSLDDISSGRIYQITVNFPMWFKGNEIFGIGDKYVESFPLNALLKHGFLFGTILIIIAIWPSIWALKHSRKYDKIMITFLIISLSYLINGLFEAQTPFGPGAKNYILWLMFGLLYRKSKKNTYKEIKT